VRFVFKILRTVPLKQDIRTMGSAWVEHVKSVYAKGKKGGMSYKQAMQKAKASWAKKKGASGKTKGAAPAKKKKASSKVDDDEKVATEKPKRAKKKARKQVAAEQAQDEPQSSKKARSSRASRKTSSIKRRDVVPAKGIAGVGAPFKE
jgi:hypothetical protein